MLNSIEAERVRNGITKEGLAKSLGISTRTYYNWINEETDVPSSALIRMSKLFHVGIDYLLEGAKGVNLMDFAVKLEPEYDPAVNLIRTNDCERYEEEKGE